MPQIDILEEYPEHLQNVLSLYIDDMEQKMSSFDKFYKQLSLFDRFVSGKVLSNKKIKLNEVKGVSVINDKGEEVPLRKLSSGEQNLIILYYKLAFSTDMRTVLLIDEPENSLHMAWVSQMLEDYQKMAEELKCQIIIATHSPAFINEHWDISCDLYTNNEERTTMQNLQSVNNPIITANQYLLEWKTPSKAHKTLILVEGKDDREFYYKFFQDSNSEIKTSGGCGAF